MERAAHRVNYIFSLLCLFIVLVASYIGFLGGNLVLKAPVPGYCSTFSIKQYSIFTITQNGSNDSKGPENMMVYEVAFYGHHTTQNQLQWRLKSSGK